MRNALMMSRRIAQFLIVLRFFVFLPLHAQAQPGPDTLGRSPPRGAVVGFLTAAHKGDWTTAVQYLGGAKGEDPAELSRQLSIVLDQGLPANLDGLSDQPEGKLKDTVRPEEELAGVIATSGGPLRVTLERVHRGSQSAWRFSPAPL